MQTLKIQRNTTNFLKNIDFNMELDEILLFPSTVKRILANIDKNLLDPKIDRMQITRLLTCRWLITSGKK